MSRVLEPDYSVVYNASMNADDIKRIRHALGLNKLQFAKMLGTTWNVVDKWEKGGKISPVYARMLQQVENERLLKSE